MLCPIKMEEPQADFAVVFFGSNYPRPRYHSIFLPPTKSLFSLFCYRVQPAFARWRSVFRIRKYFLRIRIRILPGHLLLNNYQVRGVGINH